MFKPVIDGEGEFPDQSLQIGDEGGVAEPPLAASSFQNLNRGLFEMLGVNLAPFLTVITGGPEELETSNGQLKQPSVYSSLNRSGVGPSGANFHKSSSTEVRQRRAQRRRPGRTQDLRWTEETSPSIFAKCPRPRPQLTQLQEFWFSKKVEAVNKSICNE